MLFYNKDENTVGKLTQMNAYNGLKLNYNNVIKVVLSQVRSDKQSADILKVGCR